jgi:outer membrane protein OmpA-like peptidoglycan-associated protein
VLALRTALALAALAALAAGAHADPTSGVDGALFRSSYDTNGIFAVEGARLMPRRDLSFKVLLGYSTTPIQAAVPGIGDGGQDAILDDLITLDMAFGMSLTDHLAVGLDIAAYRTATGAGYGVRGRYASGVVAKPSTGLLSLRPLSNFDPSASPSDAGAYRGDELAGPLDARIGLKWGLYADHHVAITAIGSVFLPFGDEDMLLGDRNLVFEPKLAAELRQDRIHATRLVANVAARIRQRSVLEAYDPNDPMQTDADARAFLDVGSELVAGLGGVFEVTPRLLLAAEGQAFVPLPASLSWGSCHLYSGASCSKAAYAPDAKRGDLTVLATAGAIVRISSDVSAEVEVGTARGGERGGDLQVTTGIVWAPQPAGAASLGRNDRDGDGIPDAVDTCASEPEDKDGFQDDDGCPDPDNDKDGLPDSLDKCPNDPEDKDGFEDDDGCPDMDNDGDGFPDAKDKCPNDPETVNGFEDDDGCPDVRTSTGPEERNDRIDLKGQRITFGPGNRLTAASKLLLTQVATLIKARHLTIRVEVHVPLGTHSSNARVIAVQKRRDRVTARRRAAAILDFLVAQGVLHAQVQAVGIGSGRPVASSSPTDPINDRVDFIKAQQGVR